MPGRPFICSTLLCFTPAGVKTTVRDTLCSATGRLFSPCLDQSIIPAVHRCEPLMQAPSPPEPLYVLRGHRAAVQCTAFFPNRQLLAAGDAEGEVKLWDLDSRRVTSSIRAHETHAGVLQVACPHSSGTGPPLIISQGRDGVVKCWPVHSGTSLSSEPVQVLQSGSYNFCRFALLQPGQTSSSCSIGDEAAAVNSQEAVTRADEEGLQAVRGFQPADCAAIHEKLSSHPLNHQPQLPGKEGLLARQLKRQHQQHEDASTNVDSQQPALVNAALDSEAAAAAAAATGPDPSITDLTEDLEESLVLGKQQTLDLGLTPHCGVSRQPQEAAADAARSDPGSSSDGSAVSGHSWLALPAADAADVGIWQLGHHSAASTSGSSASIGQSSKPEIMLRQERTQQKPSHGLCMAAALLQPQGSVLHALTGYEDGTVALWDTRNPNKYITSTRLHSESVMCLAVAGSCKSGFSGSADEVLAAFDLSISKGRIAAAQKLSLPGKPGIADVAMRPDGRIAASAGWDGRIRIWHAKKRVPLAVLKWHSQQVACVGFSSDSRLLAAGGRDNHISMWSLYPPGL